MAVHPKRRDCAMLLIAVVLAPLSIGRAWADEAVLLSSTAPGYAPGMVVSSSDHLNVPDGASVTLLFKSGDILRLGGPFDGTLQPPQVPASDDSVARLADIFHGQGVDASVIGGTRTLGTRVAGAAMDDVQINPRRSGTYCVTAASSVWIGRPDDEGGPFSLRRKGMNRTLAWPADTTRIEWPADVPIEDGSQFEIMTNGVPRSTITFRAMPETFADGSSRIASGILLGCQDQFDGALRRMARSAVPPELWMTTDHGRKPTYRTGDRVALTVTTSIDGYLYCVATAKDGGAVPIFPAGALDGAQVHGSVATTVPSRRQPDGLIASSDLQQIKCWLADRNISPELPSALVERPVRPLPDKLAGDLDDLFGRIGGTRVEAGSLSVNTE